MTERVFSECSTVHRLVSLAQDQQISAAEHAQIAQHLAGCAHCREYRATLETVGTVFRSAPAPQVRLNFTAWVMARVTVQPQPVAVRTLLKAPATPRPLPSAPHLPALSHVPLPAPAVLLGRAFVIAYAVVIATVLGLVFSDRILELIASLDGIMFRLSEQLVTARIALLALLDLTAAALTPETQFLISSSFALTLLGTALLVQMRRQREQRVFS